MNNVQLPNLDKSFLQLPLLSLFCRRMFSKVCAILITCVMKVYPHLLSFYTPFLYEK
ncbi:hypothetical protein BOTBODRAFT_32633 [Botryobasidium botryosum FD-172 SS1]|uniref:Uncharacterized protein n=1 Tax=Botryobasidium botryosum (strain FD-172 SS1) TaxID=930990 RepID=A0A067MRK5_BOTB1|nr:hypothetical protein BOTBODRAFT_32633 [Botryobasidium botryosum FD-172 SS1]